VNEEMTERQAYWICRRWNRWVEEYGYLTVTEVTTAMRWSKANTHLITGFWPKSLVAAVRFRDFQRAPCTSTFNVNPTTGHAIGNWIFWHYTALAASDWTSFVQEQIPASSDLPHQALNASRRWRGESWGCTYEKETERS
jgi:hypothetical protein